MSRLPAGPWPGVNFSCPQAILRSVSTPPASALQRPARGHAEDLRRARAALDERDLLARVGRVGVAERALVALAADAGDRASAPASANALSTSVICAESACGSIFHSPAAGLVDHDRRRVVLGVGGDHVRALDERAAVASDIAIRRPSGPTRSTFGGAPLPCTRTVKAGMSAGTWTSSSAAGLRRPREHPLADRARGEHQVEVLVGPRVARAALDLDRHHLPVHRARARTTSSCRS